MFNQEEVKHLFLPRDKVMHTYVKRDGKNVTDVVSFYNLQSKVLNMPKGTFLNAAYSYYTVATSVTQS